MNKTTLTVQKHKLFPNKVTACLASYFGKQEMPHLNFALLIFCVVNNLSLDEWIPHTKGKLSIQISWDLPFMCWTLNS